MTKKTIGLVLSNQPDFPKLCYSISNMGYIVRIVAPDEYRQDIDMLIIYTSALYYNSIPNGNFPVEDKTDTFIQNFIDQETINSYLVDKIPILVLDQGVIYCRSLFGGYVSDITINTKKRIKVKIDESIVGENIEEIISCPRQVLHGDAAYNFIEGEGYKLGKVSEKHSTILGIQVSLNESLTFLDKVIAHYLPIEDQFDDNTEGESMCVMPAYVPRT